jgi:dUTP pyrophosphatase
LQLKIKKLHPDAIVPAYQSAGAACFDLHAVLDHGEFTIEPESGHAFLPIRTGLAVEVPPGWVMLIFSRSGHGFKHGIRLANCVGVIDSDYRGEVQVKLHNDGEEFVTIRPGDRIAQAMLIPVPAVELVEVEELTDTARGAGGFGSTGTRQMSDREWAAQPAGLREGCTKHVPGVGDL